MRYTHDIVGVQVIKKGRKERSEGGWFGQRDSQMFRSKADFHLIVYWLRDCIRRILVWILKVYHVTCMLYYTLSNVTRSLLFFLYCVYIYNVLSVIFVSHILFIFLLLDCIIRKKKRVIQGLAQPYALD